MNIVYLLFSFTVGGTEKLVTDICREMATRGNSVHLYIVNKHYDMQMLENVPPSVTVVCRNRVAGKDNILKEILNIYNYCRVHKIDVVHCNSFDSPELLFFAKLLLPKLRIVYTVHGIGQYQKLSKARILYRNIICNKIIAISESVKKDILSYGARSQRVQLVYNAIDLNEFQPTRKKFDNQCIIIGNVARIDSQKKGQDLLIKAISLLKNRDNVRCYFAGGADKEHESDLRELKKSARDVMEGSLGEITFLGNVDDIPDFLQRVDIFVLPSRYEGFGISLIEALCVGIPCIASDINGPREIIGENERGTLFKANDFRDLADKLEDIILNYQSYKERALMAKEYVSVQYNIKKMCTQLLSLYL